MRAGHWIHSAKLHSALERALGIIKAAAEINLSGNLLETRHVARWNPPGLMECGTATDFPEFFARVGVTCAEWREHMDAAARYSRPKFWEERGQQEVMYED